MGGPEEIGPVGVAIGLKIDFSGSEQGFPEGLGAFSEFERVGIGGTFLVAGDSVRNGTLELSAKIYCKQHREYNVQPLGRLGCFSAVMSMDDQHRGRKKEQREYFVCRNRNVPGLEMP